MNAWKRPLVVLLALTACGAPLPPEQINAEPSAAELAERSGCASSPTNVGGPMCLVPAGEFEMGCDDRKDPLCLPHEQPVRRVHLDAFLIDHHEVTVAEYGGCVDAGVCEPPLWKWTERYCNWGRVGRDEHPINCVTWHHARTYCEWAGKRLPTEAQWEKAARGPAGQRYPWGDAPELSCDRAIFDDGRDGCGANHTWPVCSRPAGIGPYGNCDMIGSTYEWTADYYAADYYRTAPERNPTGPDRGELRVLRGGSWNRERDRNRASHRVGYPEDDNPYCRGIRCVLTPESADSPEHR
jgi:iron(II)-dependent oxidoreductase